MGEYLYQESRVEEEYDDSIYTESVRDELLEDDEITPEEIGFMDGYDQAY